MSGVSPYLITIALAWIIAHVIKFMIASLKTKSIKNFNQFYSSGNMPSAHTATVVSLVTIVGILDGIDSAVFAVAALFAGVVMYDSINLRRSVGEQGEAVRALIKEQKSKVVLRHVARGHTSLEVFAGLILGFVVGIVVFIATK